MVKENEQDKKEKNFGLTSEEWACILEQFQDGKPQALLSAFAKKYQKMKAILMIRFKCSPEKAETAVHQSMLNICDAFRKRIIKNTALPAYDNLESYLSNACITTFINLTRQGDKIKPVDLEGQQLESPEPDEYQESEADLRKLSIAIRRVGLTDEHKQIVFLRFWKRNTWEDVGETMDKTEKAVCKRNTWQEVGDAIGKTQGSVKKKWKKTVLTKIANYYKLLLERFENDLLAIERYAAARKWLLTRLESGLSYVLTQMGEGSRAQAGDTLYLKMESRGINDVVLESSHHKMLVVGAKTTVMGINQGLTYFKKDSQGILLIPSEMTYEDGDLWISAESTYQKDGFKELKDIPFKNQILICKIHVLKMNSNTPY